MKRIALKRITALLLSLVMTLSICPVTVWAEEQLHADEQEYIVENETENVPEERTTSVEEIANTNTEKPEKGINDENLFASETATVSSPLAYSSSSAQARWGVATGSNGDQAPETWAGSGTLDEAMIYAIPRSSGEFVYIQLLRDVDITEPLLFKVGMKVVLDLNGNDIRRKKLAEATVDGNVIKVNGTMLLCDTSSNDIENQGKITGGKNIGDGAGVYVAGNFTMNGGTISGNYANRNGGGVYASGTFTMNGGMISDNTASEKGGGVYLYGSFTMNGGTISGNTVDNGGGVYISYGVFTMNDGATISGNTAYNAGGGVFVDYLWKTVCSFIMNGGTIRNNNALDGGGGVHNRKTFTMNGGTISGNSSNSSGGGVYNREAFTMSGGTISSNTAKASGGGVINYGTFTMSSGNISGNTATYGQGGGVYVGNSTFTMTGGVISKNTALYLGGGGVYVETGTMKISGSPKIVENTNANGTQNNLYLASIKPITVADLSAGTEIGVKMVDGAGTFTSGGENYADSGYFTSDNPAYAVVADGNNLKLTKAYTVSGKVMSFGDAAEDVTIELFSKGEIVAAYTATVKGNSTDYTIDGVVAGVYTMKVSKADHVTREYEVTVGNADVVLTETLKIHPKGDVTLDGEVNADDLTALARHVAKIEALTDSYALQSADVDNNGSLSADDLTKLARYVAKIIPSL